MKEFKTVIAPKGNWYLTKGKEYEAKELEFFTEDSGKENVRFQLVADDGGKVCCVLKNDGHLKGLDWIIKEEPKTNSVDEKIKLLESLMEKFFAKINDQVVNDTIHMDYLHEAIAEFIEEEIIGKQEIENL